MKFNRQLFKEAYKQGFKRAKQVLKEDLNKEPVENEGEQEGLLRKYAEIYTSRGRKDDSLFFLYDYWGVEWCRGGFRTKRDGNVSAIYIQRRGMRRSLIRLEQIPPEEFGVNKKGNLWINIDEDHTLIIPKSPMEYNSRTFEYIHSFGGVGMYGEIWDLDH